MAIGPRQHPDFRTPEESQKARETAIDFLTRRQADPRIDGIRWKSVLDENTTVECRMLDGLEWDYPGFEPRGHKVAFPKSQNCNFHVRFHGLRTKRDPQFGLGWPSAQNDETLSIRNATPPIFTRLASQESGVSSNDCAKGVSLATSEFRNLTEHHTLTQQSSQYALQRLPFHAKPRRNG